MAARLRAAGQKLISLQNVSSSLSSSSSLRGSLSNSSTSEQKKKSLGIVHFPQESKDDLLKLLAYTQQAIGEDFFSSERFCELLKDSEGKIDDYRSLSSDSIHVSETQTVGNTNLERLINIARQCIVDCHTDHDLKLFLYPAVPEFQTIVWAQWFTHSYVARTMLACMLFYRASDWGWVGARVWASVQIMFLLLYTGLNFYQRQGATKTIHFVELGLVAVAVVSWFIFLLVDVHFLSLAVSGIVVCWSHTLRTMAGNSMTTFFSCLPSLLCLLGVVLGVGFAGEILLSLQGIDYYQYTADEVPNDSYSTVAGSFLSTFVILTSENWPTVFQTPYKHSWLNSLFFMPCVGFLNQICLGIVLGVVWASWEANYSRQVCRHYSLELRSYGLAWLAMIELQRQQALVLGEPMPCEDQISRRNWHSLIKSIASTSKFHRHINQVLDHSISSQSRSVLLEMCEQTVRSSEVEVQSQELYADVTLSFRDDDRDQTIDLCEFFSLCELIKFKVLPRDVYDHKQDSVHVLWLRELYHKSKVVNFQVFWTMVVVPCAVFIYASSGPSLTKAQGGRSELWVHIWMMPIELITWIEIGTTLLASGLQNAMSSGHRMCDVVSFIMLAFGFVAYLQIYAFQNHSILTAPAAPWVLGNMIRSHIFIDPAMWDVPGCWLHKLSDFWLIKSRDENVTWREAISELKQEDEHELYRSRQALRTRADLVLDELSERPDSLRARVHLFNRRVREAVARTFFLLVWSCVLIWLLLYFYAAVGNLIFDDTIERVNAAFSNNPGIDTDVNTFKTLAGSIMIVYQFVIDNNWNDVLYCVKVHYPIIGPVYCISFFIIVNYTMLNIVTSIVLASFDKMDAFQLVDNTFAACHVKGVEYVICPSHRSWHGLALRITLLKENKHELLQTYLNDRSFYHIIKKTFLDELSKKLGSHSNFMSKSGGNQKSMYSDVSNTDLRAPLTESAL
eukprot:TRINITY_DN18709_c0_g1_i2.p1 TRINITY_DN18709_c0_g1~~TRINITY_DN18709_c0_g1_i2.p1  ORF type:complete len:960 (-),score=179.01 TRINITY_DN18709_c0_g1_i2:176-3055(-)